MTTTRRKERLTDEVRAALEAEAQGIPPEVLEQHAERREEWTTWVATQDINFGGVLAYRTGDSVPAANVEKYRYDDLGWAARRDTKAAEEAADQAAPATGEVN